MTDVAALVVDGRAADLRPAHLTRARAEAHHGLWPDLARERAARRQRVYGNWPTALVEEVVFAEHVPVIEEVLGRLVAIDPRGGVVGEDQAFPVADRDALGDGRDDRLELIA